MIFDQPSHAPLPDNQEIGDFAVAGTKALASLIPGVGDLLGFVLKSPLEERKNDWFRDLEIRLRELETRVDGFHIESLSGNEKFVSAVLQATQAALGSHEKDKLDALRNAVLNTAMETAGNNDSRAILIALVARFTPLHLRMLQIFRKSPLPVEHPDYLSWRAAGLDDRENPLIRWLKGFVPGAKDLSSHLLRSVVTDLYYAGLTKVEPAADDIPNGHHWTTPFGDELLAFVTAPSF